MSRLPKSVEGRSEWMLDGLRIDIDELLTKTRRIHAVASYRAGDRYNRTPDERATADKIENLATTVIRLTRTMQRVMSPPIPYPTVNRKFLQEMQYRISWHTIMLSNLGVDQCVWCHGGWAHFSPWQAAWVPELRRGHTPHKPDCNRPR